MRTRDHLPLIIGISIPIVVTVAVGLSVLIPMLTAPSPMYDFIYSINDGYQIEQQYIVQNEHLTKQSVRPIPRDAYPPVYNAVLYYYDAKKNTSTQISFEEAKKYRLNAGVISPDGFEITQGDTNGTSFPFLLGGVPNDYQNRYMRGHGAAYRLNLATSSVDYYSFRFLGWVAP